MILYNEIAFLKQKMNFLYDNFDQLIFYDLNIDTLEYSNDGSHEYIKEYPDPQNKIILIERKDVDSVTRFEGVSFVRKRKMFAVGSEYVRDDMDVFWCPDADEFFNSSLIKYVESIFEEQRDTDSVNVEHILFFKDLNHIFCSPDGTKSTFAFSSRIVRHKKGNLYGHCTLGRQWTREVMAEGEYIYHLGYVGDERVRGKSKSYGYDRYIKDIWDKVDFSKITEYPYGSPFIHPSTDLDYAIKCVESDIPGYINKEEMLLDIHKFKRYRIPLYKPYLNKEVLSYAYDALDSTWVSSIGEFINKSSEELSKLFESNVLLVNNGTSAVHLMAKALKFKFPSIKKILVPNSVYVAAWNGFLYDKEYTLIPIECSEDTWNMDISKIAGSIDEETALLVVHNLGNIVNVPEIKRMHPDLVIMEDSSEAFLGRYEGKLAGTESFVSSFSFFGNKTITSGEGGALVIRDKDVFDYLTQIKGQGQSLTKRYLHENLGYNYRMTNVQAAVLYGQIKALDKIMAEKTRVFKRYLKLFGKFGITTQKIDEKTSHSMWVSSARIEGLESYSIIEKFMADKGVDVRPMFLPMSHHLYKIAESVGEERVSELLYKECLILPSYPELSDAEIDFIVECLIDYKDSM